MSRIRSKNTKPELMLRSALFKAGFRYRLHSMTLPGKPDLVFPKFKTVIFIHGCFWHLHENCRDGRLPKSKLEYWEPKLKKNVERDIIHKQSLLDAGWIVITVWECEINKGLEDIITRLKNLLK